MTVLASPEIQPSQLAESQFLQALVLQVRAQDRYGVYRSWPDELVLKQFIVSKEQKRKISVEGDVDAATQLRVLCFYRAVAAAIEKETGKLCQVVIDLSHEGFGWAIVWTGRLILVNRTLRDVQRFGFNSLEQLADQGDKLIQSGLKNLKAFPDAADA
ncbi:NifX-associated nitrogen fixation protein [Oscillatoria sp. FACHB-1406]|uniref:NifX-associated nitrogen fixation protein n=1 Tax=Oscillatoria sp. FACHB-1406 TaxID=2692846 RepID=UPI0016893D1B|nr:NifX-associated nitrogen fixation protein [Oscillatoria sp. FACHB-1406]MBD2577794.1 NifX-associated nitrogen fixation protein [Oscillatoria sp. FACHB-1406]